MLYPLSYERDGIDGSRRADSRHAAGCLPVDCHRELSPRLLGGVRCTRRAMLRPTRDGQFGGRGDGLGLIRRMLLSPLPSVKKLIDSISLILPPLQYRVVPISLLFPALQQKRHVLLL